MKRCCCFSNTRSGCFAAAVFSLVYSALFASFTVWSYVYISPYFINGQNLLMFVYYAVFVFYAFLIFASILLIVGVLKEFSFMLIAYAAILICTMATEIIFWAIILITLGFTDTAYKVSFAIYAACTIIHIINLACVISQYRLMAQQSRAPDWLQDTSTPVSGSTKLRHSRPYLHRNNHDHHHQQNSPPFSPPVDEWDFPPPRSASATMLQSYKPARYQTGNEHFGYQPTQGQGFEQTQQYSPPFSQPVDELDFPPPRPASATMLQSYRPGVYHTGNEHLEYHPTHGQGFEQTVGYA